MGNMTLLLFQIQLGKGGFCIHEIALRDRKSASCLIQEVMSHERCKIQKLWAGDLPRTENGSRSSSVKATMSSQVSFLDCSDVFFGGENPQNQTNIP